MEPLSIALFCSGVTALVKKMGISGDWLIAVCVLAGGFATYMTNYQPDMWLTLSGLWVSISTTGNVSLVKELAALWAKPSR